MESNDSPEIPDRGETSDIPGLPSGRVQSKCQGYSKMFVKEFLVMITLSLCNLHDMTN